jgi:hypothetical protein
VNGLFAVTTANTDTVDDVTLLGLLTMRGEREREREGENRIEQHVSYMLLLKVSSVHWEQLLHTARGTMESGASLLREERREAPRSNPRGVGEERKEEGESRNVELSNLKVRRQRLRVDFRGASCSKRACSFDCVVPVVVACETGREKEGRK